MNSVRAIGVAAAAGLLGLGSPAYAVTTLVTGNLGNTFQTCLQRLTTSVGGGENCTYGGTSADAGAQPFGEDIGPLSYGYYYSSATTPDAFTDAAFAPAPGDGKVKPKITGSITVARQGPGGSASTGDLISFSLTITDPNGGKLIRNLGGSVVEQYTSLTQVLAPRAADFVTTFGNGTTEYVIASAGFPNLLTYAEAPCLGAAFGSMECSNSFGGGTTETLKWSNWPATAGLGSLEGNIGAKTVGTVADLECRATGAAAATVCTTNQAAWSPLLLGPNSTGAGSSTTERGAAEDAGWDQLLLKVVTDADGNVLSVSGFDVEEYRVFGPSRCGDNTTGTGTYQAICNSWHSSYFNMTAVPVPAAAWLLGSGIVALGARAARRRRKDA